MECMEPTRALKSSYVSELAMKSTNNQVFPDDVWCVTGLPGGGEDFSIDEFFDLPNEEFKDAAFLETEEEEEKDSNSSLSLSSSQEHLDDSNSNSHDFSPDLAIPVDDLQELELWSHFMDIPEPTFPCPNIFSGGQNKRTVFSPPVKPRREPELTKLLVTMSPVPHKPRTKRSRTPGTITRFAGSPPKTESSSFSSPSSPVSTLFFPPPVQYVKAPLKKQKKKPVSESSGPAVQRRCSHCQVTKTPQWRAGPNGPKTLCNACGVRFKSGRLFPEYRPACSPTFSSEIHSNSHRKVLEMRKKKEKEISDSSSGSTSTVCSS